MHITKTRKEEDTKSEKGFLFRAFKNFVSFVDWNLPAEQTGNMHSMSVIGNGFEDRIMREDEVVEIVHQGLDNPKLDGKRVLVVIPDHTRTAPIPLMFRTLYDLLAKRVAALDFIVALGTHPPMQMEQIFKLVGITEQEHAEKYSKSKFFNHLWKDPDALSSVGTISEDEIERISGGLFKMQVNLTINKLVTQYDHVMIVGPGLPARGRRLLRRKQVSLPRHRRPGDHRLLPLARRGYH